MPQGAAQLQKQLRKDNLTLLRDHRLCIICAKAAEATVVASRLQQLGKITRKIPGNLVQGIHAGHDFWLGELNIGQEKMGFYVTAGSRQGIQTFGIESAAMFSILQPQYAVHVGSCAALDDKKIKLGNVIFGENALNYEEGKWEPNSDGDLEFRPSTNILSTGSERMDGYVTHLGEATYQCGDFISGCALRMDAQKWMNRTKKNVLRDVKALEMEASAFLQVCHYMKIHALGIIKGVSDLGDKNRTANKAEAWDNAMVAATDATVKYCEFHFQQHPPAPPRLDRQRGAQIALAHLENYVWEVVERVSARRFLIPSGDENLEVKGLFIVLPRSAKALQHYGSLYVQQAFDLEQVQLDGIDPIAPILYKNHYLIDFPVGLRELANSFNLPGQVSYFKQQIEQELPEINLSPTFTARVLTWAEFVIWCRGPGGEQQLPPALVADLHDGAGELNGHVLNGHAAEAEVEPAVVAPEE